MRDRRPLGPKERLEVDSAIEVAFAPLRARRASVSPLRVRAAVRWGRGGPPTALRWSGAISRLSEFSVAVGMSVVIFAAVLGPAGTLPGPGVDRLSAVEEQGAGAGGMSEELELVHELRFDRAAGVAVVLQGLVAPQDRLDPSVVRPSFPARLDPPAPRGTLLFRGPY